MNGVEARVTSERRAAPHEAPLAAAQTPSLTRGDMFVRYAPVVRQHALRLTGNQHDADDLTQDVFLRAFTTTTTSQPEATAGWLYRITANLFIDACRERKRHRQDPLPRHYGDALVGRELDPADVLAARCLPDDVQAALDRLPARHRSAVILRDIEALSYAEIATRLGLPIGTVRSHIHRGREQLRLALAGQSFVVSQEVTSLSARRLRTDLH